MSNIPEDQVADLVGLEPLIAADKLNDLADKFAAQRTEIERLKTENTQLRQWYSEVIGSLAPEKLSSMP